MKALSMLCVAMVATCLFCGSVFAGETEMLPRGAKVSATIAGDIATVTISGVTPDNFEFYSYKKVVYMGPVAKAELDLNKGYRFNFKFGGGLYVLLTPEMIDSPPPFVGPGIAIDCSNAGGCCFKIKTQ